MEMKEIFVFVFCFQDNILLTTLQEYFLSGHIVIADTFNNRLAYFSEDGQFIKYYRTQNLGRPSAIVVLQNGNYAVKDSQSITVFSGDGTSKVITSGLKNPYGLTINKEGNLLTIQATYLGYANVLEIDPESGEILTKVKVEFCHPGEAKRLQSKPRFIAYQGNDQLLIVDLGLNCTFIVNAKTGSIMSVFGESGKGPGQFQDPSGIACDSEGYILIGDSRNHRIQVFSPDGSFVCVLDTDSKLCRPSGICLTPYGFLYILNYWDNSLAKYKIVN